MSLYQNGIKFPMEKFVPYRKNKLFPGGRAGIESTHFMTI